jgi:carboxy-cis,cis-muconate cyclase
LEFDDEAHSLTNIANITAQSGHPWLTFSYDKASLYGGVKDGFASYLVDNSTSLSFVRSVPVGDKCPGTKSSVGSPYIIAEQRTPFNVFGAPTGTCGTAISVDAEGTLNKVVQAFKYGDRSQIKGMAMDPENKFLYSADEAANGIWTHRISDEGTVKQVSFTTAPFVNSAPRKLVVHPNGRYLHLICSRSNSVLVYAINSGPSSEKAPLTYTGVSYSLLPQNVNPAMYSGEEILLSADANVLFASSRYRMELASQTAQATAGPKQGYIRAILLTAISESEVANGRAVGAGFPLGPLFHMSTRTGGGLANAISPAPWSSDYFALADSEFGLIEVWKIDGLDMVSYTGVLADGASTRPIGGWVDTVWTQQGSIYGTAVQPYNWPNQQQPPPQPKAPDQPKTPKQSSTGLPWGLPWGQPKQPTTPLPSNQSKQPTTPLPSNQPTQPTQPTPAAPPKPPVSTPRPASTNPWAGLGTTPTDDDDDDDDDTSGRTTKVKYPLGSSDDSWTWEPETQRRSKSQLGRIFWPRQAPAPVPVAITAKIVASWQSPLGGGTAGRAFQDDKPVDELNIARLVPHKKVNVKPWTGSKKRAAAPPSEAPPAAAPAAVSSAAAPPAAAPPSAEVQAEYLAAQVERSCCANAIWYD